MKKFLGVVALVAGLNAHAQTQMPAQEAAPWLVDARAVASSVPPKLVQVLSAEIAKNGLVAAIEVCQEKAPQMARAASEQSGWTVRRVSLRNRNPKAVPDAWERAALEEFDRRAAAGESPATLEKWEAVAGPERAEYRYMKALPVQQLCLSCHGPAATLTQEVAGKLHALYPDDRGVGYALGQIRGAMTLRKPLPAQ
jgi:hypothetical protein